MALPVPPNTVKCNVVWALPQGEIAVNSLSFVHNHQEGNTLDWAGDMTQRYADLVRDAFKASWAQLGSFFHTSTSIQRVDAYHLGTDGLTIDKRTALATGTTAMVGTATNQALPAEVATVVSLYGYDPATYSPQGARKRGRIYLPAFSTAQVTGGRMGQPQVVADIFQAIVGYMQNRPMDAGVGLRERARLVVLSRKFNEFYPVTHVRVDDIFDVQTRRQNNWIPAIYNRAITPQS